MNYILEGRTPVAVNDILTWTRWFETADRRVAQDFLDSGNIHVSTVFLGIDHAFGDGGPLLFETMVFGGPLDQKQVRYGTWGEAAAGHAAMVARCKAQLAMG